jgi:penicillin-binding protein-related factor A (putative recombinase)
MIKLELRLRSVFRSIYDLQAAFVFKVPEELQQTPCDFFGFTSKGRAIVIEAKQVKRSSLPVGGEPGLLVHQVRALTQASNCGAISIVVWQHGDDIMCMHWHQASRLAVGRKSIPLMDAMGYKVGDLLAWFNDALQS